MDINPTNSAFSDTFHLLISPSHFKVEYSFAKNMKSGSTYRLVIYKGLQKVQEMSQAIKGKLVGGKIPFDSVFLWLSVPFFTPTKNIEFTIKIYEARPNEAEVEIAQHKLKSGDYIRLFSNEGVSIFKEDVALIESLSLTFDLFVHSSKEEIERIAKDNAVKERNEGKGRIYSNRIQTPTKNGISEDNLSQSDVSESCKEGMGGSIKKLSRRRGHEGKLRTRQDGVDKSDAASSRDGSVKSSRKPFGTLLTNDHNQPIKNNQNSNDDSSCPRKSQQTITKNQNLVSVTRRDSTASEIHIPSLPKMPIKVESSLERTDIVKKNFYTEKFQDLTSDVPVVRELFKREESTSRSRSTQNGQQKIEESCKESTSSVGMKKKLSIAQSIASKSEKEFPQPPMMHCKLSLMRRDNPSQCIDNIPEEQARKEFYQTRDKLFYVLFFIISSLLFYNAVTPSRRV